MTSAPTQEKPKWQLYLEKEELELEWPEVITDDLFPIATSLLLDDGDPVAASQKAAREFMDILVNKWVPKDTQRRTYDEPDDTPPLYTEEQSLNSNFQCLGDFIYGLVPELPYPSIEHDKILYFLLHIKELGNQANFDSQKNSDLKSFHYGLECDASEWAGAVDVPPTLEESEKHLCDRPRSLYAMLAKLLAAGVMRVRILKLISYDLHMLLGIDKRKPPPSEFERQHHSSVWAEYILIAGQELAKEVKNPCGELKFPLTAVEWKAGAEHLAKVAEKTPEDAPWDLKRRAQNAYQQMRELVPEAFVEEVDKCETST
ncbi:unnamed protein product [Clonostachys solani]|uniref:Uncharacterized protein n=1 Tax=Clonostachys solani TaxID=160281 RepID=A0A9N9ZB25_9HYPO|nr:unnamed protein product [Clonostachys solani]